MSLWSNLIFLSFSCPCIADPPRSTCLGSQDSAHFSNAHNFEGWNCGKITSCGHYGRICGGYNAKGKGSDIQKTFQLPAGKYVVMLDFIKIDSWFVRQVGLVALLFSFRN